MSVIRGHRDKKGAHREERLKDRGRGHTVHRQERGTQRRKVERQVTLDTCLLFIERSCVMSPEEGIKGVSRCLNIELKCGITRRMCRVAFKCVMCPASCIQDVNRKKKDVSRCTVH